MPDTTPQEFERIRESGLFDVDYYLSQYREEIPADADPFLHFLAVGLPRGFKPSARFDPLIYRIKHPQAGNPLIDYLDRRQDKPLDLRPRSALNISKTTSYLPVIPPEIDIAADNAANLAHSSEFVKEAIVEFTAAGKIFRMIAPPASTFLHRINNDEPFAFARLAHGFWDAIYVLKEYRKNVAGIVSGMGFDDQQIDSMAQRLCDELYPERGVYAENLVPELFRELKGHRNDKNFLHSVCFKGFPTADERLFYLTKKRHPIDQARLDVFAEFFETDEPIYDSTIWKRWLISGEMRSFPDLVREHPVVFVGAQRLAALGNRWKLPWLLHIPIPSELAFPLRHSLLASCREGIAEANRLARTNRTKRPIFLCQGSSFAYWLMVRLYKTYPDVFYIDMGQALHAWFWDDKTIPLLQWGKLYGKTIIRNSGLDEYYRKIGARLPPELADGLMSGRSEEGERQ